MTEPHPDPATLLRYLLGDLAVEEDRGVEDHLRDCSGCREQATRLTCGAVEEGDGQVDYGPVFARTAERLGSRLSLVVREHDVASARLAELLAEPAALRAERIRSDPRFHLFKLCERLEAAARETWLDDPAAAVHLAELAVEVAERLGPATYGAALAADAQALAWAYLGNARRVASDLPGAEAALGHAQELHRRFQGDLLTEAEILVFLASLRNTQGRFAEAPALLDRAADLYRELGDRHLEGRALLAKGMVLVEEGRQEEAIRLMAQASSRIDAREEPRLLLVARHNLAYLLVDLGRNVEALELLAQTRKLYLEAGNRMDLIRLRWLEGRIALGLGRLDEAERSLTLARDGFLERGIAFDAALASLELALVAARRGDTAGVRRITAEVFPVFLACEVEPDAFAALLMLRDAAEAEHATAGLIESLAAVLRRSKRHGDA
jgi:tetratricopeptide (TPR) repeat protein